MAYESADLLDRLKTTLQIGSDTSDSTDAQLYQLLSNAQERLMGLLAAHCPWTQVGAPELLATADSGVTYTTASYPMGHMQLFDGADGPQIMPLGYGQNLYNGYVLEGQTIRFPGNRAMTFSSGLYARYVAVPDPISASSEPTLKPAHARLAIVYMAAAEWAHQGGAADPAPYEALLQKFLWGDPRMPGDIGLIGTLKTQAAHLGYAGSPRAGGMVWWRGNPDFA